MSKHTRPPHCIDRNKNLTASLEELKDWYLGLTEVLEKKSFRRDQEMLSNFLRIMGGSLKVQELNLDAMERFKMARMQEPSP